MSQSSECTNIVSSSSDGISWTKITAVVAFDKVHSHCSVVFDEAMWVIGGSDGSRTNKSWKSSDGATWTNRTSPSTSNQFPKRKGHICLVFNARIILMAGRDNTTNYNDVYQSRDGSGW